MSTKINIAFDLHGVLDKFTLHEDLYMLKENGISIYVLSGSPSVEIIETLTDLNYTNIHYDGVYSIVDYVKDDLKIPCYQKPSLRTGQLNWYCDEAVWWTMKSILCNKHNIDMLIDDKIEYGKYFGKNHKTKFYLIDEILSDTTIVYQEICDKL